MREILHSVYPGSPTAAFPQTSSVILYLFTTKNQDFRPCKTTRIVTVLFQYRETNVMHFLFNFHSNPGAAN
jgi:hypothetical protein